MAGPTKKVLNNSHAAVIDRRRRLVAAMRLRGLTQREIANGLALKGHVNPYNGGSPWSLGTINSDIKALRNEWREGAAEDIKELKSIQFAEIREAKREAWLGGDLSIVARFLKMEIDLLGTAAPQEIKHYTELTILDSLTDEELLKEIDALFIDEAEGGSAGQEVSVESQGED